MRSTRLKIKHLDRNLVDAVTVFAKGGNGGEGALSYRKHTSSKLFGPGTPWGGPGGRGGDVVLEVCSGTVSLRNLVSPTLAAEHGGHGRKRNRVGTNGEPLIVRVPPGVIVSEIVGETNKTSSHAALCADEDKAKSDADQDAETRTPGALRPSDVAASTKSRLVKRADMLQTGEQCILARGGEGGCGNDMHDPHSAGEGQPGEHRKYLLELQSIADVGLVGFPNAGKSSFLRCVSRSQPKVASYPFTTIAPYVGSVQFKDGFELSVADVPGLVEDAHLDRGLGHEFLRHLERTKVLLYCLDCSSRGAGDVSVVKQIEILRAEIGRFSGEMAARPFAVLCNKCDLGAAALANADLVQKYFEQEVDEGIDDEACRSFSSSSSEHAGPRQQFLPSSVSSVPIFAISARTGVGISGVVAGLRRLLGDATGGRQRQNGTENVPADEFC
ncbi:unnamed protein product [Amoebophrya sp. A120]|nr:unnamed protein product [Amoebophrya sp. A120]|eukprot:GSA120T00006586001.1